MRHWVVPQESDSFSGLRQEWCDSLRSTGLLPQILQRLGSEDKAAPLSDAELQPFLAGLRRWLGVSSEAVWNASSKSLLVSRFGSISGASWRKSPEIPTHTSLISWCLESRLGFAVLSDRALSWPLAFLLTRILGLWSVARLHGSRLCGT